MIDFAIKNKLNGMVITSSDSTDDSGLMEPPYAAGEAYLMIRGGRNLYPTLYDFDSQLTTEQIKEAKQSPFDFIRTIVLNNGVNEDEINPLPFGEDCSMDIDDETYEKFEKDNRTWQQIINEILPQYQVYTLALFEHSDYRFSDCLLSMEHNDFDKIDGFILLNKSNKLLDNWTNLPDNYDDLLSDWFNGYYKDFNVYLPAENGKYEPAENIGMIYNSEDNFSYKEDVAKMVEAAWYTNCSDIEIDRDASHWEKCEPSKHTITYYTFD